MKKYNLIVKTAEAEIRALENVPQEHISNIFPIIEITRGRKITRDNRALYPFDKRLSKFKNIFKDQMVCIDVTSDPSLSSAETLTLFDFKDGYSNWVKFLLQLKEENVFSQIIPTVLWNFNDSNFEENIKLQISSLIASFGQVAYRNPIEEEGVYEDMELFLQNVPLIFILDCGYVPGASCNNVAQKGISRLNNLKRMPNLKISNLIVAATSFPNNVTEFGDLETDTLKLSEVELNKLISADCDELDIEYGDYGSINPIRNDTINMARGWVPRIDVSNETSVFYHRIHRPKGTTAYSDTYIQVAKACVDDPAFPHNDIDTWGVRQIRSCAQGSVPSSAPSFWISVRMNMHIKRRLQALKLI